MPIEIRELVIRARVEPGGEGPPASPSVPAARDAGGQELVRACVREVLRILEARSER